MLQDVIARRPTEIDALNGGIVRFGRECGVPTPLQRGDRRAGPGRRALVDLTTGERAMTDPARTPSATRDRAPLRQRPRRDGRARRRRAARLRQRVQRLRGRGPLPLGLPHRAPLRLRAAAGATATRSRSSRARRAGSATTPTAGSRTRSSPSIPGAWIRDHLRAQGVRRLAVYGLDYVMAVRDYRALAEGPFELLDFEVAVRHLARRQERGGARARAREHGDQRGRASGPSTRPTSRAARRPS